MSHATRWLWSTQFESQLSKIGGHCPSEGGDKAFLRQSLDHTVKESRELVGEIPSTKITKAVIRSTELNDKNISVLQIGASLCYKLGQLCFITN